MNRRSFLQLGSTAALVASVRAPFLEATRSFRVPGHPGEWEGLAAQYSLSPGLTYFNHGSIGTIPKVVQEARQRYLDLCESNPALYMWEAPWEEPREEARGKAAKLLGIQPVECAITHNTTEGFNLLASGLELGPGDEVLFSSLNHVGASACWEHQAQVKGFEVRRFDFPVNRAQEISPEEFISIYENALSSRTRVLVCPHIDNIVGFRYPLEQLARRARAKGVEYIAVDGAQSAGMIPVDLSHGEVDFYATSAHKWIQAPKGLGLLFVRKDRLATLRPFWVTWGQSRWKGTARIFEDYGTRNLAEVVTLGDALEFHSRISMARRVERLRALWDYARERIDANPGFKWRSPRQWDFGSSLFSVEVAGKNASEVAATLEQKWGIVVRPFPAINALRLSLNVFNLESEIDDFIEKAPKA